ncbi:hypothetical protein MBLNU457_7074t2 [Dothideomycetes sp. NU457]
MADPDFLAVNHAEASADPEDSLTSDHWMVEALLEHYNEDQPAARQACLSQEAVAPAPGTQKDRQAWAEIFDVFWEVQNKDHRPPIPDGKTIHKFLQFIINNIKPRVPDPKVNKVPALSTIISILQHVLVTLRARYPGFKMTAFYTSRCEALLQEKVNNGSIRRGSYRKRQYVGFQTLRLLAEAWLVHNLNDSCLSWDVVLSRLLGIVLLSATAC